MRIFSQILRMFGGRRGTTTGRRPAGVGATRGRTTTTAGGGIGSLLRRFLR